MDGDVHRADISSRNEKRDLVLTIKTCCASKLVGEDGA